MVRDLVDVGIDLVRREQHETVKDASTTAVEDRLIDLLLPGMDRNAGFEDEEANAKRERTRERFREQLRAGELEDRNVEIVTEDKPDVNQLFGAAGQELGVGPQGMFR